VAIADPAAKTQRRAARGSLADGELEKVVAMQMKVVVAKTPDRRRKALDDETSTRFSVLGQ
jgi:hypothetical protein